MEISKHNDVKNNKVENVESFQHCLIGLSVIYIQYVSEKVDNLAQILHNVVYQCFSNLSSLLSKACSPEHPQPLPISSPIPLGISVRGLSELWWR